MNMITLHEVGLQIIFETSGQQKKYQIHCKYIMIANINT